MTASSFFSSTKFYDNENFPSGFPRSGNFTVKEAEMLSDCGFIMQQLAEGNLRATDEEQEHFLLVVSGKLKPLYFIEHTYLKYLNSIKKDTTDNPVKNFLPTELLIENLPINNSL